MTGLGLALLRLALAAVFIAHGANILFGLWAGPGIGAGGLDLTTQTFAANGIAPAFPMAVLTGVIAFGGGIMLALGWFTRYVTPVLAIVVAVLIWKMQWTHGFLISWVAVGDQGQGFEYSLVLMAALIGLSLTGAGEWSIDGRREAAHASQQAGRARLRGKL